MVKEEKLEGLDGWLLIYIIGSILLILNFLLDGLIFLSKPSSLAIGIIYLVITYLSFYALILTLQKKKKAIGWNIFILVVKLIFIMGITISMYLISRDLLTLSYMVGFISTTIWTFIGIGYFKKSERVKNTLVK